MRFRAEDDNSPFWRLTDGCAECGREWSIGDVIYKDYVSDMPDRLICVRCATRKKDGVVGIGTYMINNH